jgi:hypothetical protein
MMLMLILDVPDDIGNIGLAYRETSISVLPAKSSHVCKLLMDSFRGVAFKKLCNFKDGNRGFGHHERVNLVFDAADL